MTESEGLKTWVPWGIKLLLEEFNFSDDIYRLLARRLATYPEMEAAWNTLLRWDAEIVEQTERNPVELNIYTLASIAITLEGHASIMSDSQRDKTYAQVAKHAKLLRVNMLKLGMPSSIHWYLPNERTEEFIQILLNNYYKKFEGKTIEEEFSDRGLKENESLTRFIKLNAHLLHVAGQAPGLDEYTPKFNIYEFLQVVFNEEYIRSKMPGTVVRKAKYGNARRLLFIRGCANLVSLDFGRDPNRAHALISSLARTAFDEADIDESTVKDALRGYDIAHRKGPRE